jgi:hypothetical protein
MDCIKPHSTMIVPPAALLLRCFYQCGRSASHTVGVSQYNSRDHEIRAFNFKTMTLLFVFVCSFKRVRRQWCMHAWLEILLWPWVVMVVMMVVSYTILWSCTLERHCTYSRATNSGSIPNNRWGRVTVEDSERPWRAVASGALRRVPSNHLLYCISRCMFGRTS